MTIEVNIILKRSVKVAILN